VLALILCQDKPRHSIPTYFPYRAGGGHAMAGSGDENVSHRGVNRRQKLFSPPFFWAIVYWIFLRAFWCEFVQVYWTGLLTPIPLNTG
jgi:hypothetical protein